MPDRTTLALAACAGLTDDDLAQRGAGSFKAMIERKRKYAAVGRILAAANQMLAKDLRAATKANEALKIELALIKQLDAPVADTTQALGMLTALAHKPGAPGADAQG